MFGLDSPERQRLALFAVLLVGGAVLFQRYAWAPLHADRIAVESHLTHLERANRQARALTQPGVVSELRRRESEYEVALAGYETLLPDRFEASALLAGVAGAAQSADVEIVRFAPREAITGRDLVEVPYDVQVQGSYHDVGRFLSAVINLPQLVRPEIVALAGVVAERPDRGEPDHQVLGTLVLSAYIRTPQLRVEPAGNTAFSGVPGEAHARTVTGGVDEG